MADRGPAAEQPDHARTRTRARVAVEREGLSVASTHAQVRQAILDGTLTPGSVISQVQLAERLLVSRTPLREALRLLETEGLIHAEPNRRVRVSELSVTDLEQIYAMRISLEVMAVHVTVPVLAPVQAAKLEACNREMARCADRQDYDSWHEPHQAFHAQLVEAAGARVVGVIAQLSDHAERYRRAYTTAVPSAWGRGTDEHRLIQEAATSGNTPATARLLARHYTRVALSTVALLAPEYEPRTVRQALMIALGGDHAN